jgi:tetratricopeptide (TPR) repeat protein
MNNAAPLEYERQVFQWVSDGDEDYLDTAPRSIAGKSAGMDEEAARAHFWNKIQAMLQAEMVVLHGQGWEVDGELSNNMLRVSSKPPETRSILGAALSPQWYLMSVEIPMRRPQYFQRAQQHFAYGDYDAARADLSAELSRDNESISGGAYMLRAIVYCALGDYMAALFDLEQASDDASDSSGEIAFWKGATLRALGNEEASAAQLEQALGAARGSGLTRDKTLLARTLLLTGQAADAKSKYYAVAIENRSVDFKPEIRYLWVLAAMFPRDAAIADMCEWLLEL